METPINNTQKNHQHIVIIKPENKQPISLISKIKSKMKKLKSIFVMSVIALFVISCEKDMGKVQFRNRSVTNKTYTIIWDGSVITTLSPQTDSEEFDVAAGKHTLVFNYSNTGATACNESNPVIASDETRVFTCSY